MLRRQMGCESHPCLPLYGPLTLALTSTSFDWLWFLTPWISLQLLGQRCLATGSQWRIKAFLPCVCTVQPGKANPGLTVRCRPAVLAFSEQVELGSAAHAFLLGFRSRGAAAWGRAGHDIGRCARGRADTRPHSVSQWPQHLRGGSLNRSLWWMARPPKAAGVDVSSHARTAGRIASSDYTSHPPFSPLLCIDRAKPLAPVASLPSGLTLPFRVQEKPS